jgi:hypothetical protein
MLIPLYQGLNGWKGYIYSAFNNLPKNGILVQPSMEKNQKTFLLTRKKVEKLTSRVEQEMDYLLDTTPDDTL